MKLTPVKPNQTVLELEDGTEVFFSYRTPVAARVRNEAGRWQYIATSTHHSVTTSRHITQYAPGAARVGQEVIDALVK